MEFPEKIHKESEKLWGENVRLLVVDDEEVVRTIVRERLEIEGFLVDEAQNGRQALAKLGTRDYAILLTDIRMPEMDGIALLQEATHRFPGTSRIVMTAHAELETAVAALKNGAFDYILKPFSFDVLIVTIRNALGKHALERQLQEYQSNLENKVREQTEVINSMYIRSINALIKALEAKDFYTRGHSQRVTMISLAIGREMNLSSTHLEDLRRAAILHDLGKIGVREGVLNKPAKLTQEEFREVVRHPEVGTQILSPIPLFRRLLPAILHHHERFDGSGYPGGLARTDIPIDSRIMTVADAYDAMTSDRAYRSALPVEKAMAEIQRCSGTQFDPEIVSIFLSAVDQLNQESEFTTADLQDEKNLDDDRWPTA
jgi:response regulator RpfG family c-di-GMP phosphodiesterase